MRFSSISNLCFSIVCLAVLAISPVVNAQEPALGPNVKWDAKSAKEVAHALHHMHELVNEGKFMEAADMIVGDDVLMTFELGMDNNSTPVAIRSKEELFKFMQGLFEGAEESSGVTVILDKPIHKARATKNIGIVTEECTVRFRYSNGTERVDKLYGTNIAVKYPSGWKFIQWHMSVAKPSTTQKFEPSAKGKTMANWLKSKKDSGKSKEDGSISKKKT